MKKFEKIKKKYRLNNSYFKNRRPQDPSTPFEVFDYVKQHKELPYNEEFCNNWLYDCFVEYQKRAGVFNSQFFTPEATAKELAEIAYGYTTNGNARILDACCGFGQITKELFKLNLNQITAFDFDAELVSLCQSILPTIKVFTEDFKDEENIKGVRGAKYDIVVSNPPYEVKELTEFLYFSDDVLVESGIAVLLIPMGFLDKSRPKRLVEILNQFHRLRRTPMNEEFARTKVKAEIVELRKI